MFAWIFPVLGTEWQAPFSRRQAGRPARLQAASGRRQAAWVARVADVRAGRWGQTVVAWMTWLPGSSPSSSSPSVRAGAGPDNLPSGLSVREPYKFQNPPFARHLLVSVLSSQLNIVVFRTLLGGSPFGGR